MEIFYTRISVDILVDIEVLTIKQIILVQFLVLQIENLFFGRGWAENAPLQE